MSPPTSSPVGVERMLGEAASSTLRDSAKVILWGLVLYGAVEFAGSKLSARPMGALAVQLVIAEWGAGRLAVAWSDPLAPVASFRSVLRRAGKGAAIGTLAGALVVGFALATGGMTAHPNRPDWVELALGLPFAALLAARDELLFRGVVLRAFRRACPTSVLLAICGGAALAAEYGVLGAAHEVDAPRLLVAALLGVAFAALWLRDRGAWLASGAHTGWILATSTAIGGGIFDLRASSTSWGGANAGIQGSLAAITVLVPLTALAVRGSRGAQKTIGSALHVRR